jgi:hypothetical protein
VKRERVLQIDRVQNQRLWTMFCIRRKEVIEAAGGTFCNQNLLWYAADTGGQPEIYARVQLQFLQCTASLPIHQDTER